MVRPLLEHGGDVSAKTVKDKTPLHIAARWGYEKIARLLLAHGADVSAISHDAATPLHFCQHIDGKGRELKMLLLQHGADVSRKNKRGRTPQDTAALEPFHDIVAMLQAEGMRRAVAFTMGLHERLQGYLAHKKTLPPRDPHRALL
ncbi:ankyrin repeat-containing domain protein [Baffinella frigidus]|nr:ankyrin repeat-containing domain protein [Cryptophyta sp. CCMP2293]